MDNIKSTLEKVFIAKFLKRLATSDANLEKLKGKKGKHDPITKLAVEVRKLLRKDAISKASAIYLAHKQLKENVDCNLDINESSLTEDEMKLVIKFINEEVIKPNDAHLQALLDNKKGYEYIALNPENRKAYVRGQTE